jgi:hypothetical protein
MRCIAALILLFAAATNALAPVASIMVKGKKVAKKLSKKKSKTTPPKLETPRPRKEPERLGMVTLDDATVARLEALIEDTTTFGHGLEEAKVTKYPTVRDFEKGKEYVILRDITDEDTGMITRNVVFYRKSYAGMNDLEKLAVLVEAFEQS